VRRGVYKARVIEGRLLGRFEMEGVGLKFIGVRAPVILEKDDGAWREAPPVELFNGRDLAGWRALMPGQALGWTVRDGILTNTAGANNLLSEKTFWNFALHAEFRVGSKSNSGIGLRGRYEIQILEDYGQPPDTHGNGALYSRVLPTLNASRPAGEWQTYDIRIVGRTVSVVLNGKTVIDRREAEGPTAIAMDADETKPGPVFLQGDHGSVEFRKITVTPLVRK